MEEGQSLDKILKNWDFDPGSVSVRMVKADDGRDVIQMRIELGVLQLETTGRPDGWKPEGADTYFDHLLELEMSDGDEFEFTDEQCFECDREFVQFYHRRICWLAMQEYDKAVLDADHTLGLMDMCLRHSSDEQWKLTHEQYRPFVLYHRVQASAMHKLVDDDAEGAIQAINLGLDQLQAIYERHEISEDFEEDELAARLIDLRESLRDQFDVGRTLREQLADAVASEQYEQAARIRDEIQKKLRDPR
ncbi:MAG: UvrB/UvrC motif-containing protein [Planctomycetota bacterium]